MENKEEKIKRLLESATEHFVAKQYQQAIDILDKVLDIEQKNTIALNSKAAALANLGRYEEAIKYYDKELEIEPNFIPTLTAKAFALANLGKYKEAIECCDKVLEIEPKNILALNNKVVALSELGRYQEAIEVCDKVLKTEPENIIILNNKALALSKLGKYQEAIEVNNKVLLEKDANNIDALNNKAAALAGLSKYHEAIEYCDKVLDIETKNMLALYNKAFCLVHLGKYQQAIEYHDKVLEIEQKDISALCYKAFALANLDRYEEAIVVCDKILKIEPKNKFALLLKIEASLGLNKHTEPDLIKQIRNFDITTLQIVSSLYTYTNAKKNYDKLKELLNELLDAGKDDIYKDAIKDIDPNKEDLSSYKSIYIDSLLLVALLRVDMQKESGKKSDGTPKRAEDDVAHYTRKCVAESMLFQNSKEKEDTRTAFRLSSIVKANDPEEGNTLFSFLGIDGCSKEMQEVETRACFIGCFTFNHSSLNQYRLYGKEGDREATGVSLVLQKDFFAADMQQGVMPDSKTMSSKMNIDGTTQTATSSNSSDQTPHEDKKHPLFRCVYVDPKTGKVISVGHREEYTFYRESKGEWTNEEIAEYKKETEKLLSIIKRNFESLKNEIEKLKTEDDKKIVYQLLIHLRYLVKHMAFKEEQECRIVLIEELYNNEKIQVENDSHMYIDYLPIYNSISHVYFAPQANDYKLFAHRAMKDYDESIKCRRCDHPFSC